MKVSAFEKKWGAIYSELQSTVKDLAYVELARFYTNIGHDLDALSKIEPGQFATFVSVRSLLGRELAETPKIR